MSIDVENIKQFNYWNEEPVKHWIKLDSSLNERFSLITSELFKKIDFKNGQKALDIGCGSGFTSKKTFDMVGEEGQVLGIDISEPMLNLANKKYSIYKKIKFINADVQNYKFRTKFFDHVVSRFGVMFFDDPIKAFKNIKSSLKKNATLTFVCWGELKKNDFFTIPIDSVLKHLPLDYPEENKDPGPLAFSDKLYIKNILKKAGYQDVCVETVNTKITTKDSLCKNATLLMNVGIGARILRENLVSKKIYNKIKETIESKSKVKVIDDFVSYNASINIIRAKA